MSLAIYPSRVRGLDIHVMKSAHWNTVVQQSPSFSELRIVQSSNPLWHWVLIYNYVKDHWDANSIYAPYSDYQQLQGFFLQQQGKFSDFLYDDPNDDFVGPALLGTTSTANPAATLQVVTDGAGNYFSPITRNFGGQFQEDITDLNTSIVQSAGNYIDVYCNGSHQLVGSYTVAGPGLTVPGASYAGMYISWGTTNPTQPVSAQFNFFFRVRFEEDTQDFETFLWQVWTIGGPDAKSGSGQLKLMQVRPPGV